jgi:hypothetical protein
MELFFTIELAYSKQMRLISTRNEESLLYRPTAHASSTLSCN